ncbi:CLUMA_CG015547, isoform A [Clunio marinus]|uniref:CLUMA_CG015547, isoform A n=1 Tax=Clunio marinus TaxID=568069 RepID=A0A1J1IRZ1_9DIPT|nr:CLUMA_CG015547, isoform A [Clunio marinus]
MKTVYVLSDSISNEFCFVRSLKQVRDSNFPTIALSVLVNVLEGLIAVKSEEHIHFQLEDRLRIFLNLS